MITYERRKLNSYGYRVKPRVRLIDNATSAVLWQYEELFKPQWDDPTLHFTEKEIEADGSQRLGEVIELTYSRIAGDVVRAFRAARPTR